jgi:uncharacterized membrane protein
MLFTVKTILTVLLVLYPIIVYFGLNYYDIRIVSVILLMVFLTKFIFERNFIKDPLDNKRSIFTLAFAVSGCLLSFYYRELIYLKFYPVCVNVLFLVLFSYSLTHPPSMIEKFARLKHKNLDEKAIAYLRKVTIVWCGFFIINGSIAAFSALFASVEIWTLYNGLISYILMGGLFLGEMLYRKLFKDEGSLNE